eukprot:NODE_107_length_19843_cov_0.502077.p10 type:complete len:206 gc:universal NODE_107_length_19843_cov_0.502077:3295-3912(+)
MTDYFDASCIRKQLSRINPSSDSIGSVSHYLNFHSRYCNDVMEIWKKLILNSKMEQQLLLLYVINDLVTISRRKSRCFQEWIMVNLPSIWNDIRNTFSLALLLKIQRLFDTWSKNKLFPKEFVNELLATSNLNPFVYIVQDAFKSLRSMNDEEKKEYLYDMVNNAEECCKELRKMQNQYGSPRQVSNMLLNIDQEALNKLLSNNK